MKKALIISGIKWNTTIQRHHEVAKLLSRNGYNVDFLEGVVGSKFSFKKLIAKILSVARQSRNSEVPVDGGIRVIKSPFINPQKGLFAIFNNIKLRQLCANLEQEYDLIVNYLPVSTAQKLISSIPHKSLVYDCVRDFANWGGYPKNVIDIENWMVTNSAVVLVDSYYLADKMKRNYPSATVKQILPMMKDGQADIFKKGRAPSGIKNITYVGQISDHIDINVLKALKDAGYVIHHFGNSTLKTTDIVISHGFMSSPTELAKSILDHSDALIIPYKGNMDGVIPAKLFECLATGLPVFVSSFYDARKLNHMLYVYDDINDLAGLVGAYSASEQQLRNARSGEYLSRHTREKEMRALISLLTAKRSN